MPEILILFYTAVLRVVISKEMGENIRSFSMHILLVLFTVLVADAEQNKYSKASNTETVKPTEDITTKFGSKLTHHQRNDKPFRTNKLNLLWQKAQKRFDQEDPALKKLFKDFISHDKLELDLKKKKSEGHDESGEHEAIVREKLLGILESYGLADYAADTGSPGYVNTRNESPGRGDFKKDTAYALKDKRLAKMWQKAVSLGFSGEELVELKTELIHQQKKIDEYNILKNEVTNMDNFHENSVDRIKNSEEFQKDLQQKKMDLKRRHREMQDGLQFLEASATKVSETSPDFDDPRVVDLWLQIKNGNFSDEELEGFKEELKHFERKIEKHQYLKTEMSASQDEKMNADMGRLKLQKDEKMERKLDEYDRKIKKTYSDLKHRINKALKHTEL